MLFRKAKLHQRCPSTQILLWRKTIPLWSWKCFKRFHFPLNTKCPQNTSLPMSPSLVQKSILCWGGASPLRGVHAKSWPNMHVLDCQPISPAVCHAQNWEELPIPGHCTAACPAPISNPHPLHKHRLPPRVPDSRTVSLPAGGTLVSSQSLIAAAASIYLHPERRWLMEVLSSAQSCIDLENCRQSWHEETENWKKTADVGMHEERSECSLVFSINFDLCDLLPTFLSFSSVSSIYA